MSGNCQNAGFSGRSLTQLPMFGMCCLDGGNWRSSGLRADVVDRIRYEFAVSYTIRVTEAADFIVVAGSGILHIHSDDLSKNVFAEGTRGQTNRFLLKFRKPDE